MAVPKMDERFSWQEYLSWAGDERFELIDGIPYMMSPAPRREHQALLLELGRQLANQLRGKPCSVYPAPFDVKLSGESADEAPTVVQPDLTVVCDSSKLTEQGVSGAPDLVVEIVSPDSGYHDRGRKYELYESYGVPEYWIVDPNEKVVEVYRLNGRRYDRVGVFAAGDELFAAAVPDLSIDLKELFG
jgi:Uma2 family endonuclease